MPLMAKVYAHTLTVSSVTTKLDAERAQATINVPIGAGLKDRFPSNWELSTARATSVVRYLIDEGRLVPELLTAAGHADTQPVAANDSEEGRSQNRRIEIALYPKDLKSIAEGIH